MNVTQPRPRRIHSLAFTLIELLVVVAIIGILVALLKRPGLRHRTGVRATRQCGVRDCYGLVAARAQDKFGF
ncbi:MAG: type IV pilin protein [Mycobacteriales bacterium]